VHFLFPKNCAAPQRGLAQRTVSERPHRSQFSCTKVRPPQCGQGIYSGRPQPEQIACAFSTGRRQDGQRYPNGLPLPQTGQKRESGSIRLPHRRQGFL